MNREWLFSSTAGRGDDANFDATKQTLAQRDVFNLAVRLGEDNSTTERAFA